MPSRVVRSPFRAELIRRDRKVKKEVREELTLIGNLVIGELDEGVSDWTNQPEFKKTLTLQPALIAVLVTTKGRKKANKIFKYVDEGTKGPYYIFPKKKGGRLRFKTGYDPKTQPPGKFKAGTGQSFGEWVSKEFVLHPGIKARNFIKTIDENIKPTFRRRIENALRRGMRRS